MRKVAAFVATLLLLAAAMPLSASDRWQQLNREILDKSVALCTVAGARQVPILAAYLAGLFRDAGWAEEDIHLLPYEPAPGDPTAALIVRWPAAAPRPAQKPILLLGHLDVVDAKAEDWTVDPFGLTEKDGYLYGRGVSDNKQGVAAITTALLSLRASGFRPKRDIILLFTGDEETTGHGAELAVSEWRRWTDAELALNSDGGGGGFSADGKPLGFMIQTAEKGYASYDLIVRNKGGHSSRPRPDNAIYRLSHALLRVEAHRFEPQLNETTRAYFEARQRSEPGPLGDAMRAWLRDPGDGKAADRIEAEESETGLTRTRCVATMLAGGHADNALPQLARATVNCRIMPGVDPKAVEAELSRIVADPEVEIRRIDHFASAPASPLRRDVLAAFAGAVHRRFPDMPIIPAMDTGGSDAVPFRAAGIPVYGVDGSWGILPEDVRAHGGDERLKVRALDDELAHWLELIRRLAG